MAGPASGAESARPPALADRLRRLDPSLAAVVLGSLALVVTGLVIQVRFGDYSMSLREVWFALLDADVWYDPHVLLSLFLGEDLMRTLLFVPESYQLPELARNTKVVWHHRIPRVLVGIMVGLNFAVSGTIFQAVTRNELASPYTLGVTNGAAFVVILALVFAPGLAGSLPLLAGLGGAAAFLVVYTIAWKGGTSPVRLVLAGIVIAYICTSLQHAAYTFAEDVTTFKTAINWTMGSLTGAGWGEVRIVFPWTVATIALSIAGARQLDVLSLGEETASALGMSVERIRFGLSAVAILAASSAIAVAGVVAFVGLIVPHMVRTIVGSSHWRLLVGCCFVGPALLVVADVGARLGAQLLVDTPVQLPVGVVTGIIGGTYFVYLMRRRTNLGEL
ncbi:FecCD family ABC transporter permease [Halovivax limisalsi]|uniref:FecCD family ABC transporter permease n=1 Tax=Halovivax limisalsi TaxID=1453760 RepID=UPI001FFC61F1|nr:iron ABC transporter permease [Halovivax limisalsi]